MSEFDRRAVIGGTALLLATAPLGTAAAQRQSIKTKGSPMTAKSFTTENSIVMLVDHQTGTVGWVKSIPWATVITSCRVLAKMAVAYDMSLILTTTVEQQVGPTIEDLQEIAPQAYAKRYARGGQLDAWTIRNCKPV